VWDVSINQIIALLVPLLLIENKYLLYANARLGSMKIYFKIKEIVYNVDINVSLVAIHLITVLVVKMILSETNQIIVNVKRVIMNR
jgi:hypothetical protein